MRPSRRFPGCLRWRRRQSCSCRGWPTAYRLSPCRCSLTCSHSCSDRELVERDETRIRAFMESLHLDQLIAAAVFIGARVSGLMVFCPFLGSNAIPARVKAVLVLLITAILSPLRAPL